MSYYSIVDGWTVVKTFDTLAGAKTSFTRKYKKKHPDAVIMDNEELRRHKENEPRVK